MDAWYVLSDAELRARLVQRDHPPEMAEMIVRQVRRGNEEWWRYLDRLR